MIDWDLWLIIAAILVYLVGAFCIARKAVSVAAFVIKRLYSHVRPPNR